MSLSSSSSTKKIRSQGEYFPYCKCSLERPIPTFPRKTAAHSPPNAGRGSHYKPHGHDRKHVHHLRTNGHRGGTGNTLILADNKKISQAIQGLQKICFCYTLL